MSMLHQQSKATRVLRKDPHMRCKTQDFEEKSARGDGMGQGKPRQVSCNIVLQEVCYVLDAPCSLELHILLLSKGCG